MMNKAKKSQASAFTEATGDTAAFLGVSLVVGILVGVAAALLIWAVGAVGRVAGLIEELSSLGRFAVLITVPLGLFLAWSISERFAPDTEGDGVPEAMAALAVHSGYMPTRSLFFKLLVTGLSLGGGGSGGQEGPIVQVGGTIGSSIARHTNLSDDQIRSLVAAGAGAAVGASFNAPIAGMLFAMEVILGSFATRHLSSVVVASVSAAVTAKSLGGLIGSEAVLRAPIYRINDLRELGLYAVLGLLVVPVAWSFLKLLDRTEDRPPWMVVRPWTRPVGFGLIVAVIGVVEPGILGTGHELIKDVLNMSTLGNFAWTTLIVLMVFKILATAMTLSSGGSGGAFFPSLFIGATLGAGFAVFLVPLWGFSNLQPGAFAVVGMAATFAAVSRAPLTAILIVFEITGLEYGLVLPLMLTTILATTVVDRIHPESAYTMPLVRRGIRVVRSSEVDLLDTVQVSQVMGKPDALSPEMTLGQVQGTFDRLHHFGMPVAVDGTLVGILSASDLARLGGASDQVTAAEAMTERPVTVTPGTPVSVALEKMAALGVGRLPVVSNDNARELVGMFGRESAVRAYHIGLSASTAQNLDRERLRVRTDPGASFFDFRVPKGSSADGKLLKEVVWPEGCTLVSVRRERDVMVPDGGTRLVVGDVITAFGTVGARTRVIERLNATAEEPTAEIKLADIEAEEAAASEDS